MLQDVIHHHAIEFAKRKFQGVEIGLNDPVDSRLRDGRLIFGESRSRNLARSGVTRDCAKSSAAQPRSNIRFADCRTNEMTALLIVW